MQCSKIVHSKANKKEIIIRRLPPTGSLEAFLAAGRAGSLRQASEELNLSVSALSRRIQKLEHQIGRELFSRRGNEFRLNEEGNRLFAAIDDPFNRITTAFVEQDVTRLKSLVVGVPTSFATSWLIPRLESFRRQHPQIELRLDTSGSPIKKLGNELDVIIFFAQEGAENIEFEPLRMQGAFAVSRKGLVDLRDGIRATLRKTPVLVHRHLPQILENWLQWLGVPADFPLKTESFDDGPLLMSAAQNGLGMALVLEDMVNFYGQAPDLVRPFGEYVSTQFSYAIAVKPASGSVQAIEQFRQWIIQECASDTFVALSKERLEAV